jgi:hypothetical protein
VRQGSAALFALLLAATVAQASSRTIDDCEQIKDAMAYNACLASFGPTRGHHGPTSGLGPGRFESVRRARSHGASGAAYAHIRGGRMHMEFTPHSQ